jgi:hypothetical protein
MCDQIFTQQYSNVPYIAATHKEGGERKGGIHEDSLNMLNNPPQ